MIPKRIHYCWFGRGQMPDLAIKCIESWHRFMPDYEYKLWNEDNFNITSVPYVKEAYESRKYAFVTDYVRLYALFTEGGIYMDTDVELLSNLDKFLNNQVGKYSYDDLSINILYLSTIDTEKCRLDVFKDVVGDIKNFKQIEDVSAYAKFVDGTMQYPDKDDLSSYWGLNGKGK